MRAVLSAARASHAQVAVRQRALLPHPEPQRTDALYARHQVGLGGRADGGGRLRIGHECEQEVVVAAGEHRVHAGPIGLERAQHPRKRIERSVQRALVGISRRHGEALQRGAHGPGELVEPRAGALAVMSCQKRIHHAPLVRLLAVAANEVERLIGQHLVVGAFVEVQRHAQRRAGRAHRFAQMRVVHVLHGHRRHVSPYERQERCLGKRRVVARETEVRRDELAWQVIGIRLLVGCEIKDTHVAHLARTCSRARSRQLNALERRQRDDVCNGYHT